MKLRHDFSGDHWIDNLSREEAYDITDKINSYTRNNGDLAMMFKADACQMANSWSVYLRYRMNVIGVYSYADLYIKMREYDSQLKKILHFAGVETKDES